jgi:hypothetical protein
MHLLRGRLSSHGQETSSVLFKELNYALDKGERADVKQDSL